MATRTNLIESSFNQMDSSSQFSAEPKPIKSKSKYRKEDRNPLSNKNNNEKPKTNSSDQRASHSNSLYNKNANKKFRKESDRMNDIGETVLEILEEPDLDHRQIKPDFFIDEPPTPEYRAIPKGRDVTTQIYNHEIFDFEAEAEPILQVLVGRSIECSRIELIEEYEREELDKLKAQFKKQRDSELMVTQRMEYGYIRRKEENERRALQHKIETRNSKMAHKKYLSLIFSKKSLAVLKLNPINQLEDYGFLRINPKFNIQNNYIPWMHSQGIKFLENDSIEKRVAEVWISQLQKETELIHQKFIEQEMQRRKKNEEERKRIEKEIEEKKRKRKERRMKKRKMREKNEIFENLRKFVFSYPNSVYEIFDAEITDITGENKKKPVVSILGGYLGALYVVFKGLNEIWQELKHEKLPQAIIKRMIVEFLNEKIRNYFTIKLNKNHQQLIEENLKLMDENLEEFNLGLGQLLEELINSDLMLMPISLLHLKELHKIDDGILKSILKIFYELIFKSINYKDLEPEKKEDEKPSEDQGVEEKKEPSPKQIITQEDLDMIKARGKLRWVFEVMPEEPENDFNCITKCCIPLNYNNPKDENEEGKEENKEEDENENKEIEESFIEPFDGNTFKKTREQYYEMQVHEIRANAFNIWQDGRYKILNLDKKSQLILFKNLLEFFISIEKNLTEINSIEALERIRMISEELEENLCQKLVGEDKDSLPIFDYEL